MIKEYQDRVDRLAAKIKMSQTPVPGFIIGLSGTDSILAFLMIYDACARLKMDDRVLGVHYVDDANKPSWFGLSVIPWLRGRCPQAVIETHVPLGGNADPQRWADLHLRALNVVENGKHRPHPAGENYWIVGTINATEKTLGTYSLLATAVSIQPLQTLYKSDVLAICRELNVPEIALERSCLADCPCGRNIQAARNIKLVDDIIRFSVNPMEYPPELVAEMMKYVKQTKQDNDFKMRVPYVI